MDVRLVALKVGVAGRVTWFLENDVVNVTDAVEVTASVAVSETVCVSERGWLVFVRVKSDLLRKSERVRLLLCFADIEMVSELEIEKEGAWYVFVSERGESEMLPEFDMVEDNAWNVLVWDKEGALESVPVGDDTCDSLSVRVCVSITVSSLVLLSDIVTDRDTVSDSEIVLSGV